MDKTAYTKGYRVYTTINSNNQTAANRALRHGLMAYDQRHGFRGPVGFLDPDAGGDLSPS